MSSLYPFVGEMYEVSGDGFRPVERLVLCHSVADNCAVIEDTQGVIGLWKWQDGWRIRRLDTPVSEFKRLPYVEHDKGNPVNVG